ncbi:ABC transporter ATP-binding protein [Arthrobacter sp. TES]|uniref:ABC transporter ATP-binding protein n=1 Tax=Paenarthrobacter ureafaciens TaxID=37931 RepID=UPI000395F24E|nr:ABC transporter ATP-binding protein [Paenarthrobacter ureafaciens]AOY72959.1 High-affinity branched-chain amino acid transport ATP-binding protein BraG [Arthrobacter sp. ZXY-2]QOI64558.1 ABC transporter ATP-binding protein [Arthrobacter sp. TES]MBN9131362.1 ABC transporter ATP-binding protein [Paenarthrobacter ureafaciens]GLU61325.1 ABC transporter ATP-binding protein [Paenarthrobacter ureafaciens]GLU65615.1 ABC transporter ATP-binding protein [Paenarthrobacter ureafaciens]
MTLGQQSGNPLLRVRNLVAGYGRLPVVRSFSLDVASGEAVALLGPNGHGKTTALRAVAGLGKTSSGEVTLEGRNITGTPAYTVVDHGMMHVPQGNQLFPRLSIRENLLLAGRIPRARNGRTQTLEMVHELFPKLLQRREQLVGTLSGGERQMVAIGMGLMAKPKLLVLDEPTLGLAPKVRYEILETLHEIRALGLSLIVADGDVDFLFELTDRWHLVELGRIVAGGTTDVKPSHEEVMDMYIGASTHLTVENSRDEGAKHV